MAFTWVKFLLVATLFTLFTPGRCQESTCQRTSKDYTLWKNLLRSYDKYILPVKSLKTGVKVLVRLTLAAVNFDETTNTLTVFGYMIWVWSDPFLTWDKESVGITQLQIDSEDIWTPDIALITAADTSGDHYGVAASTCTLNSKGRVLCVSPTVYEVYCDADITKWPFDRQKCSFSMGSSSYLADQLNISFIDTGITHNFLQPSRQWHLEDSKSNLHSINFSSESYTTIEFQVVLRRHSAGHEATIVIPAYVLAAMTLVTFFLDVGCSERLILGSVNTLAHCFYLQYLGIKLPSSGYRTPDIVVFFRDSLFLVCAGQLLSVMLHFFHKASYRSSKSSGYSTDPPVWVGGSIKWILSWRAGQILLLSRLNREAPTEETEPSGGESDSLDDANSISESSKTWRNLASLLNRVFFIVFCLVFFVLLARFVP